jgi:hypothetical protein
MDQTSYKELVESLPMITADGIGIEVDFWDIRLEEDVWQGKRQQLLSAHQEFEYCCEWIGDFYDLLWRRSACHLKHLVENRLVERHLKPDHILEGVFIVAAIYSGYRVRRHSESIGAQFGEYVGYPGNAKRFMRNSGRLRLIKEGSRHSPTLVAMK